MLFSSIYFLFVFLPAVLLLYFLLPVKYRNLLLFLFSIVFYSWGEPVYVFLMLFSAVFNYLMALDIHKAKVQKKSARWTLLYTVGINLFILCFFKYYGFLTDTFNEIFHTQIPGSPLPLPIGISFYTFQALSYIFDVYAEKVKVQKSLLKFSLYLCLFPQLIAGPIVKYKDIAEQLDCRETTLPLFGEGVKRFIFGLSKKVILANSFGLLYTQITGLEEEKITMVSYWIAIIAYTLQIYFDFSGYSDMAIGLGKMFGFTFPENFDHPYLSASITEFWRRWHISLSTWFKEYVYIPLGGNRTTVPRHILNLLIVWSLTGLWHGANWNFVLWGLYYGLLLIAEKYLFSSRLERTPRFLRHLYTLFFVVIGWVFFSSEDLAGAIGFLKVLFGMGDYGVADITAFYYLRTKGLLLLAGIFFSADRPMKKFEKLCRKIPLAEIVTLTGLFLLCTAYLIFTSYNPFLYFRF